MNFQRKVVTFELKVLFLLISITLLGTVLRVLSLNLFPPALYSDEVAQGYNAYSILKTGRDEHGTFLPVAIRSFGDWKSPLQTYLAIPTIAIFGLNEWGVRLPSAILGSLTILLSHLLVIEIATYYTPKISKRHKYTVALLSSLFLAISPWHLLQSRAAMLVAVTLFFLVVGLLSFFKSLHKPYYLVLSSICFVVSIYGYYGMRLTVPLLVFYLIFTFKNNLKGNLFLVSLSLIIGAIMILPLIFAYTRDPNVLFGRTKSVSVFYDKGVSLTVGDLITQDGPHQLPKLSQFFHNKPYHYTIDIIRRFFHHFDGRFLFLTGDKHPPFEIPGMGVEYISHFVLLVAGAVFLLKSRAQLTYFLFFLGSVAILPSAFTFLTPSQNRSFPLVIPLSILSAFGLYMVFKLIKNKPWIVLALLVTYTVNVGYFMYQYFYTVPQKHAEIWHYGYKELFHELSTLSQNYEYVVLSGKMSMPYIFMLFYQKIEPSIVKHQIERNRTDDEFGFEHVESFDKYLFIRSSEWEEYKSHFLPNSIVALTTDEKIESNAQELKKIYYPDGDVAFKIYKME